MSLYYAILSKYNFGYNSVAVGKFKSDFRLDLVVANYPVSSASVLLGNGDGTFGSRTNYGFGHSDSHDSVAVADFDGDGTLDFATSKAEP